MSNAYLPRDWVHARSEELGETALQEQAALQRVLKQQRRLTRWLEENAGSLEPTTGGVAVYLFGVVARMFDLAGGRLRKATWEQVRAAERQVGQVAGDLLPFDDGFQDRVRQVAWRAQPHLLDEALMNLFDREAAEDEADLSPTEAGKVFFLLWVAITVLDQNWAPDGAVPLTEDATHVPIEPPAPKKDGEEADAADGADGADGSESGDAG